MNNINTSFNDYQQDDDSFDFVREFFKYFIFWKYFIISIGTCLLITFLINRYLPKIYEVEAKIQILDKKQNNLEMPTAEDLFSSSKINLENEIEIIKSTNILIQVINNLGLNIYVEYVGEITSTMTTKYPFDITINFFLTIFLGGRPTQFELTTLRRRAYWGSNQ